MPQFHSNATDEATAGLDDFTRGYIEAAYWTETGDNEQPDSELELALESIEDAKLDCAHFQRFQRVWLDLAYQKGGYDEHQAGIDFWLTRNGHGAGFWDRGLDYAGDALSKAARSRGQVDLMEGDDGLLYLE